MAIHEVDIQSNASLNGKRIHDDRLKWDCDNHAVGGPIGGGCTLVEASPKGNAGKLVLHFVNATLNAGEISVYIPEVIDAYDANLGPLSGSDDVGGDSLTNVGNINGLADGEVLGMVSGNLEGVPTSGFGGADANAVHVNAASEISGVAEKVTPAGADVLLIEDSADSGNKKRIQVGNLPTGGGGEANDLVNAGTGVSGVATTSKTGANLRARGHAAGSSKMSVTEDAGNENVVHDVVEANIVHQNINGAGTKTHTQIDTHIDDSANPHGTSIANLGSGTAAQLDAAVSDGSIQFTAAKDQANGYAGLSATSKLAGAQQTYGSTANTACEGNDARLSDARAPTGAASGDLGSTFPGPIVEGIQGEPVSATTPTAGQTLVFTGGVWTPTTPAGGGNVSSAGGETAGNVATFTAANTVGQISVTGAQLTTLTNGSDADPLHDHAIADAHIASISNPHGVTAAQVGADATGTAAAAVAAHEAAGDPHAQYQLESEKSQANGYAGLDASSKLTGSQQVYGSSVNTACEGNDGRLPATNEKDALVGTSGIPNGINPYVTDLDSRLSDSRAPNGSASGDLSGSYPGPTVERIQGEPVSVTTPTEGQTFVYTSGTWTPAAPSGGGSGTLASRTFSAGEMVSTFTSNWPVSGMAPLGEHVDGFYQVRLMDDTVSEGAGFHIDIPVNTVNLTITTRAAPIDIPGAGDTATMVVYFREIADGAAQPDWSSSNALTTISFTAAPFVVKDVTTDTLVNWGLTAGRRYIAQIVKTGGTMTGDLGLESVAWECTT